MKTKIANYIYQILWFGVLTVFFPFPNRNTTSFSMDQFMFGSIIRFETQIQLAKFISRIFNVRILLLIGDSNSGVFNSFSSVIGFNAITITMGIPGTQATHWNKLFSLPDSRRLIDLLDWIHSKHFICWNIGGNHVLQRSMHEAESSLKALSIRFPNSFNILIPPIHTSLLEILSKDIDFAEDVNTVNCIIIDLWMYRAINLRKIFLNPWTNDSWYGLLADPVHYSMAGKKIITQALNLILGFY